MIGNIQKIRHANSTQEKPVYENLTTEEDLEVVLNVTGNTDEDAGGNSTVLCVICKNTGILEIYGKKNEMEKQAKKCAC